MRSTARVGSLVRTKGKLRRLRMVPALMQLTSYKFRHAVLTLKSNEASPDLPVNILPFHQLLIVKVLDEPIDVKVPVRDVLRYNLPVEINENLSIGAHHPLVLILSEQLVAVKCIY